MTELSVLTRRFASAEEFAEAITAREKKRNAACRFTTADARVVLRGLYPDPAI